MLTCNLERTASFVADHIGHMYVGDVFPCRARLVDTVRELLLGLPESEGITFSSVDPAGVVVLPIIHIGATNYLLNKPYNKKYTKRDHSKHYIDWEKANAGMLVSH